MLIQQVAPSQSAKGPARKDGAFGVSGKKESESWLLLVAVHTAPKGEQSLTSLRRGRLDIHTLPLSVVCRIAAHQH
jgi:hypothetical protein